MKEPHSQKSSVENKIIRLLENGLVLSEETLFFAESTYGLQPSMLAGALQDPGFEERDGLLALILSPEMSMRTTLEPLLADLVFSAPELTESAANIRQQISSVDFSLSAGVVFSLFIDLEDISYLVKKLYLDRAIDKKIDRALRQNFSEQTVIESRIVLRCRGDSFCVKHRNFICRFIEKCGLFEDGFIKHFTLLLALLAEISETDPIENHLLSRKHQLIKTIKDIREFEKKREQYSMEYLMMQRYRVPHESEEELLKQLYLLRTITETILGLPADPSIEAEFRHLGSYRSSSDVEKVIRVLS